MERWHAKVITLVGCFLIPFVCTILPIKVSGYFERKGKRGQLILSCMMCFGGGVFFSTFILHMAPEARDILTYALKEINVVTTYPIPDLLMALGFFLVLFTEKFILIINEKRKGKRHDLVEKCVQYNRPNSEDTCPGVQKEGDVAMVGDKLANHHSNGKVVMDIEDLNKLNKGCNLYGTGSCCKDPDEVVIEANAREETGFLPRVESGFHEEAHNHEAQILQDPHTSRALILLVALSFHRIFEGMSIGLQKSLHNVFGLFTAVMFHEAVIGFSLGLQFVKNKWSTKMIMLACFLCSLIMPFGVFVGTLIMEIGETSVVLDIINGVLQSLATGTFIYVTFFEILQEELSPHDTNLLKVLSVFLGFALMAALSAIPEEQAEGLLGHDGHPTNISNCNMTGISP